MTTYSPQSMTLEPHSFLRTSTDTALPNSMRETVLVVDTDDAYRKRMSLVLTDRGYHVLEACGGAEALSICRNSLEKIDLILTDLLMRGMDGIELIGLVRRFSPGMKVLFIAGIQLQYRRGIGDQLGILIERSGPLSDVVKKVRKILDEHTPFKKWLNGISSSLGTLLIQFTSLFRPQPALPWIHRRDMAAT